MKQYQVYTAKNAHEAEDVMNKMAKDGWRVVSTTFWSNFSACLIITFEKDV